MSAYGIEYLDDAMRNLGEMTDYAVNGVTQLILMKSDVLDGFDTIKACVAYKVNGEEGDD